MGRDEETGFRSNKETGYFFPFLCSIVGRFFVPTCRCDDAGRSCRQGWPSRRRRRMLRCRPATPWRRRARRQAGCSRVRQVLQTASGVARTL